MADITGNTGQIDLVSLGDTINDWRTLTNDQVIAKLNLLKVYDISAGIGLDVTGGVAGGGVGGTYDMQISDTIAKGITIGGDLVVTGSVSFSNAGEVSFPNGLVNVNGDNTPVAGAATAGIVVGSYTGPDFNSGTTAPFFLNVGGSWFTNQDLKLIGGGTLANSANQRILFGETNGKTLSFSQTATDLVIGNDHLQDIVPVGTTLAGQIARIRSSDGRVDIMKGVNKRRVSGISHGFSFGKVVRATDVDATGFTLAIASGGATYAEAVGMISRVNGNSDFEVTFNGEVEGNFIGVNDASAVLSIGCPYFISAATEGNITTTEPSTDGHISKPVMIGLSGDRGLFVNYRGQEINSVSSGGGGSSGDGTSIRRTIASSGFSVGNVIAQNESGTYELVSNTNSSRMIGIVVNNIGGGHEILLYGMSRDSDTFRVGTDTDWVAGNDTLLFADTNSGSLTATTPADGAMSPAALKMGNHILFYNTRFGQGYSTPATNTLNTTSRSAVAYTAAQVAGGLSGPTEGGGGYAQSTTGTESRNILVNGAFHIWQRGIGVGSAYTGTADTYFADRWIRTTKVGGGTGASAGMSIIRSSFDYGQNVVLGNPRYYATLSVGVTGGSGETAGDNVRFSNIIENANTAAGTPVLFSFYAHGTTGATGFLGVEYAQHWNGSDSGTITTQKLDLVYLDGSTKWTRYVIPFNPMSLPVGATTDPDTSYARISFLPYRYNGLTGTTGSADVSYSDEFSIAQCRLENGFIVTNPVEIDIDEEYRRTKRFYQTTYNVYDYKGKNTLVNSRPDQSSPTFTMNQLGNVQYIFPVPMRATPTSVLIFSPSGAVGTAYNVNVGKDLAFTSGTKGYNNITRTGLAGSKVTASSTSSNGVDQFFPDGYVALDVLTNHIVASSEFNTGVTE